jgi:hypothetical protein
MKKEQFLQLIGIAIFLIVTSLTYGIVTPVKQTTTNTSLVAVTNEITNTTNNTTNSVDDNSQLTDNYHIIIAITAGVVIALVTVFLIGSW